MADSSPTKYFPLRWESTGDQWWYASPIDWAAANGHYDLVRELLRIDGNHLIKLTSLRRIRRLETVWDDDKSFHGAAKCRSAVARRLFLHCESAGKANRNSLIRAGYGGWLIYTAASAGDLGFVRELLDRNPLLVFGEGEYGVTDVLYAAARGKNRDVFRLLLDSATAPELLKSSTAEAEGDGGCVYRWEMMNRAVHAAARGGNLTVLKELLSNCSDVLAYRDAHASTILHTAAGRGQVEIVKYLIETFDVITASTDRQGNTALHVAAFRGQLAASEAMISASPQLIYLRNTAGETFLHRAVSGFQSLQFRPLDRHVALLRRLVGVRAVVNARNSDGLTALHAAVIGNVHSDLVQILMSADGIDLNATDSDGLTALDHLRLRPRSASSDVLIRRLISAGAVFSGETLVSRLRMMQSSGGSSPGSSFRISDAEIFLHAGIENNENNRSTVSPPSLDLSPRFSDDRRRSSFAKPVNALKQVIMNWPKKKKHEKSSMESLSEILDPPTPLRKRFSSKPSSPVPGDKRSLAVRSNQSSPLNKKMKKKKRNSSFSSSSPPRSSSEIGKRTGDVAGASCSGNNSRKVKSQYYLCFGNAGVSVKGSPVKRTVSLVA